MTAARAAPRGKVRKTLTLDADLVDAFNADDPESLSGAVNAVLRAEQRRREQVASVRQLADDLDALYGPADADEVAAAAALLA
ncbi:MAG: hypothetical protein LBQ06_04115 [Frankiaceae bacterium]|jgi:hypothetical protein|nr:hypothetical protein [Frankiaceae bacterium]